MPLNARYGRRRHLWRCAPATSTQPSAAAGFGCGADRHTGAGLHAYPLRVTRCVADRPGRSIDTGPAVASATRRLLQTPLPGQGTTHSAPGNRRVR
jgi:hypothetical protein